MLEVVLASSNPGKIVEIKNLLKDFPIRLIPQSKFNIFDVEETGLTFVENSILKARHAAKHSGLPALADDSGLVVTALNGAPGVFSSRYAGSNATDLDRINKVLSELKKVKTADRRAYYHCVTTFMSYETDPAPLVCHGIWEGEIIDEPRGNQGFGYDPIFYVADFDRTAGEMDLSLKDVISHRGRSMQQLKGLLASRL